MDGKSGAFPLHPSGPMTVTAAGVAEPLPLARGQRLTLAPEDPARRISIEGKSGEVLLYDGRNKAQNGWYVVRSLIPPGKSGLVVDWFVSASTLPGWTRAPMIAYSQLGYHPGQRKVAVIELDANDTPLPEVRVLKFGHDGTLTERYRGPVTRWGRYLRYEYSILDFPELKETGLYLLEYGSTRTRTFRIEPDLYANAWHLTSDVYLPVQMDHMFVNEAYRVWHGASHLDDALQAPVSHEHFDLHAQGPTTDTPFKPGEHIPGLSIGGWYDAGDFDIRTQTQYAVVMSLVQTWEQYRPTRDETTVDQKTRCVDIHVPDGTPDLLQQIEHGTLALIAQHRALGRAIPGIVEAHLDQYTLLGDGSTKTDNLVYDPKLGKHESDGIRSGAFDDRWAFTSRTTPLNYGSAAALAAANSALRG